MHTPGIDPRADLAEQETKRKAAEMGASLTRFFLGLLLVVPLRALVASYFWQWFAMPVLPGAPSLSIVQAYGVLLVVTMFLSPGPRYNGEDKRTETDKWWTFLIAIPGYLSIWFIGWLFLRLVYL